MEMTKAVDAEDDDDDDDDVKNTELRQRMKEKSIPKEYSSS